MERISALVDGELDRDEVARVVRGMKEQEELRDAWSTYHLIGDALRGERCLDVKVIHAVVARLDQEPTILAPRRSLVDSAWRLALPSMAAAAAVATLAWIGLQTHEGPPSPSISSPVAELALPEAMTPQSNALVDLVQPVYLSTPPPSIQFPARNIDAYLQAHREFSPSKTMQGLVSYARSVSTGTAESGR
jgi:sigma-E factor negative regulatory protein RseA